MLQTFLEKKTAIDGFDLSNPHFEFNLVIKTLTSMITKSFVIANCKTGINS